MVPRGFDKDTEKEDAAGASGGLISREKFLQ
jgi:hypothetical protein